MFFKTSGVCVFFQVYTPDADNLELQLLTLIGDSGELETLVDEENNELAVQLTIGVLSAVDSLNENNVTTTNTSLVRILTHTFTETF